MKDKIYPTAPLAEVEAEFEREDLEQIKAWGDTRDDARWGCGEMAMKYLDRGLPYAQVLIIIGNHADYSHVAVKKFLSVVRWYAEHKELELTYRQWLRYSIMAHATRSDNPGQVLEYALKTGAKPLEIMRVFPSTKADEAQEEEPETRNFLGVEYKAFARWGYSLFHDSESKKQRFDSLLKTFIGHVRELLEAE